MHRWTQFAQAAASAAYDLAAIEKNGGDMCVPMLRTLSCVFASVGPQIFGPFVEGIVHPAVCLTPLSHASFIRIDLMRSQVHRISAAVVTDGESEYCDPSDMWDGFSANFIEFLENILLHPSPHCTDVLVRYDVLSCIMRLLKVCCCTLCAIPQEFGSKSCRRNLLPPWKCSLSSAQHPPTTAQ